jgi:hypothetical protein
MNDHEPQEEFTPLERAVLIPLFWIVMLAHLATFIAMFYDIYIHYIKWSYSNRAYTRIYPAVAILTINKNPARAIQRIVQSVSDCEWSGGL